MTEKKKTEFDKLKHENEGLYQKIEGKALENTNLYLNLEELTVNLSRKHEEIQSISQKLRDSEENLEKSRKINKLFEEKGQELEISASARQNGVPFGEESFVKKIKDLEAIRSRKMRSFRQSFLRKTRKFTI